MNNGIKIKDNPRPFIHWAGGKTQLLEELYKNLIPYINENREIPRYIEPFLGGGAFFFFMKKNFDMKEIYLFDIHNDLVLTYKVVQNNVYELINELEILEKKYLELSETGRKDFYFSLRIIYNQLRKTNDYEEFNKNWISMAAAFIFFNKTSIFSLFKTNKYGDFIGTPGGNIKHKSINICDKDNLIACSEALQDVIIINDSYENSLDYINKNTFVYLDPPYRPLKGYSKNKLYINMFNDKEQIKLAQYCKEIDKKGGYFIQSNSDPKNEEEDDFFDELYKDYNIIRVEATRQIKNHKKVNELIIKNYR